MSTSRCSRMRFNSIHFIIEAKKKQTNKRQLHKHMNVVLLSVSCHNTLKSFFASAKISHRNIMIYYEIKSAHQIEQRERGKETERTKKTLTMNKTVVLSCLIWNTHRKRRHREFITIIKSKNRSQTATKTIKT